MTELLHYFAYGSNMCSSRLGSRVPEARGLGVAVLHDYRLHFHKPSADGSAKCNVVPARGSEVLGVLYALPASGKATLDRIEGRGFGYSDCELIVHTEALNRISAWLYLVPPGEAVVDDSLAPYDWYKEHVVAGAREWGLPEHYVEWLSSTTAIADPDADRSRRERGLRPTGRL